MSKKKEIILEMHKMMEIYKAGFLDGFECAKGKEIKWKTIFKRCSKAFNKRFLKPKSI